MARRTPATAGFLLAATLLASGCDDATSVNPCEGVDCSGHGVCHSDGFWPLCSCDPGWVPSGRWCVPGGDVVEDIEADTAEVSRTCGDGVVDLTEECDDGNADDTDGCTVRCTFSCHLAADCEDGNECTEDLCLTVEGGRACSSGPTRVGESCDDGNDCTTDETCNDVGECIGDPAPADTLCDDGLYCNGSPDVCDSSGRCVPMSMPPCPVGGCVGGCDEATDTCLPVGTDVVCRPAAGPCDVEDHCDGESASCPADEFAPAGTACDDGTGCTGDQCDGAGTCIPNTSC
ncbi:MAG: hypothetical protein JXB32_08720 [Deltaproteobacteria bacterium]|nr:hypothetical protein [Deltaproteobacteria bacterium]